MIKSNPAAYSIVDHVPSVPIGHSSLLGMPPFLLPGQVTGMHPFVLHQPGVPHSMPPQFPQSHVGNFHSIPAMSSLQQWQNQQAPSESLQIATQIEPPSSQNDQNLIRSDAKYHYETSVNGQPFHQDYLDVQIREGAEPEPVISSSLEEAHVLESINSTYLVSPQTDQSLQQMSSQFTDSLRLDSLEKSSETKAHKQNVQTLIDHGLDGQVLTAEKPNSATKSSKSDTPIHSVNLNEITINNSPGTGLPESFVSTGHTNAPSVGRTSETALLDERLLLAWMVRTIPAGGRIRISSTSMICYLFQIQLPNRLGKMLAPLDWHDYKKKYGKLDDFVAAHTELFVIEGDYIQLREGAQEMIAATAAVARVATHRLKKISSLDSKNVVTSTPNANNAHLQSVKQNHQLNGVSFGVSGGMSNVKILSKSKDMNGPEPTPSQSSVLLNGGNGAPLDRSMANGRHFLGKQHGRMTNSAFTSRR
ncbi:hypothetical protein RchiOBHm_Chr1g0382561 [Rosa chinensis]|uniref:DUF7725 domain-containing protein n=1 Tax=Rosa chinensis TaxID=74649 RepID=A0A2P6SPH8_ROSCH|nr:hypothetical protein RchiOBHm_Chr1g0382561 [Rosa chinensis]